MKKILPLCVALLILGSCGSTSPSSSSSESSSSVEPESRMVEKEIKAFRKARVFMIALPRLEKQDSGACAFYGGL